MNSHQRRKKRRQWHCNKVSISQLQEFTEQLQTLAKKMSLVEFAKKHKFEPLPYQIHIVDSMETAKKLVIRKTRRVLDKPIN